MRIPEADGAVLAAAQAVVTVGVEARGQHRSFMSLENRSLLSGQLLSTSRRRHPLFLLLFLRPLFRTNSSVQQQKQRPETPEKPSRCRR